MTYEPHQCPIRFRLGVFGDRWSLLIVRDMLLRGHTRFQDFLDADEGISTNILTDRLRQLETQQVISRHKDPSDGRQVIYQLTDKGRDLLPVLLAIFVWAEKHDPETRVPPALVDTIKTDLAATDKDTLAAVQQSIREA